MLSRPLAGRFGRASAVTPLSRHLLGHQAALVRGLSDLQQQSAHTKVAEDVKFLKEVFWDVLRANESDLETKVRKLKATSRDWRDPKSPKAKYEEEFKKLCNQVEGLDPANLRDVARAFSHLLALSNVAETHTQGKLLRQKRGAVSYSSPIVAAAADALPARADSCVGTLEAIVQEDGGTMKDIYQALTSQQVEIVFTAHPTEVNKDELLTKHRKLSELLERHDEIEENDNCTLFEMSQNERAFHRTISAMWGSDVLRRSKPTPQEEARDGLSVIPTVLFDALPDFLRRLNAIVSAKCHHSLPLTANPIVFSSWMGGDRDGNPNVTHPVTREVVTAQRHQAALLYLKSLGRLRLELSVRRCTDELAELAGGKDVREPYKAVITKLIARLRGTVRWAEAEKERLNAVSSEPPFMDPLASQPGDGFADPLFDTKEFVDTLVAMHKSLVASGYEDLADGGLIDLIRQVSAFGLQLAPLDLRQESTRHLKAVDALAKLSGVNGYAEWPEEKKVEWLSNELKSNRPLLRRGSYERLGELGVGKDEAEVLKTAALTAELPPGSLRAYVISQATSASDVLAVELLMAEAGTTNPLPVAPLFETLDDLNCAPDTLRQLFSTPGYKERTGGKQMVMVGYSDSAKDAGRIAAMWAQYTSQEKMLAVAKEFGFHVTFFHGKGGTVGRGGNPEVYKAVLAHPQGTIGGRFRITEQGEMISKNWGDKMAAERTMDIYTAAVLRDQFKQRPEPTPEWRETMAKMSDISCDFYRSVVRGEPRFVPYFRSATPELELGGLNVGSRPAKRNPKGGVESLRAIPWIFAWAQTRLNLPVWLGIGKALDPSTGPVDLQTLRKMYKEWPWFNTTIDLIEMIMAKSERAIAEYYDRRLVQDPELLALGQKLRERFQVTEQAVLDITEHTKPQTPDELESLRVRNHLMDVLNIIQVETLLRLRAAEAAGKSEGEEHDVLKDALLVTINGIATGMRNSA